eukprot:5120195-Pyramimonas_sp.AAC.1
MELVFTPRERCEPYAAPYNHQRQLPLPAQGGPRACVCFNQGLYFKSGSDAHGRLHLTDTSPCLTRLAPTPGICPLVSPDRPSRR